jgi:hypothetical protein
MSRTPKQSRARNPWYERLTVEEIFERDRVAWNLPRPRPARPLDVRTVVGVPAPAITTAYPPGAASDSGRG